MTTLTMRNTKAEMFAAIQELQAQLASANSKWAETQQLLDEACKYGDDVTEELRQATQPAKPQAAQPAKPQAPARPVTDRGAVLAVMREFAIANNCPTRLRNGEAQYYSYRVNAWLDIQ